MPDPDSAFRVAGRGSEAGTCPSCGQPLLTRHAVRRLHQSERKRDRAIETAARARLAELLNELMLRVEAEHREAVEHVVDRSEDEEPATPRTEYAHDVDVLRTFFRQF
jgi:hypothetical protein